MSKELSIGNLLPFLSKSSSTEISNELQNKSFVGIDFGTSTTVVSIATLDRSSQPIKVKTIDLNQKLIDGSIFSSYKVPSVIAYYQNAILVGEGAKQLKYKLKQGKNLWHSFKMELGEDVGCKYPQSELGKNHKLVSLLNPVDVSTLFFKYLKSQIDKYIKENNLPKKVEYAVSIPASFEANQRKDLIQSMESNGMLVSKQSLIDEPNAAFLSYVLNASGTNQSIKIPEDYYPNILVFDFGAGTCDISILELGQDQMGVYSKNIAISKFEKLGGDDIDRLIAVDILLPQLMKSAGYVQEDFRTKELQELIIPKLMPSAERLKIQLSELISLRIENKSLEELIKVDESVNLGKRIEIESSKGVLSLEETSISIKEFVGIMSVFTKTEQLHPAKRIEEEIEFVSIFNPIKSALKKAGLNRNQIDYVLFIGGSSKNPLIQKAVSDYFIHSDKLIPRDLQAHVSAGAAIHSLIYNGFGKNIIQPITSEPIMLITKDGYLEKVHSIVEAGTVIPTDLITIDNLAVQREGQEAIELPICVGNKNKILYNIKLHSENQNGFKISDKISLQFEISPDKMLVIRALAGEKRVMVEPLSPFSNKELTTEQRIKMRAEKEYNLSCEKNGGVPTYSALYDLYEAYNKIGLEFKAAETLEMIEEHFPGKGNLNNIGLHYKKAGKKKKAKEYYDLALEKTPSATTAFNIAMLYEFDDQTNFKKYLEKALELNPKHGAAIYNLGRAFIREGKNQKGAETMQNAYDLWKNKFDCHQLEDWEYGWFASCARALGKHDMAEAIEQAMPEKDSQNIYNPENLTQILTSRELTKKKD